MKREDGERKKRKMIIDKLREFLPFLPQYINRFPYIGEMGHEFYYMLKEHDQEVHLGKQENERSEFSCGQMNRLECSFTKIKQRAQMQLPRKATARRMRKKEGKY
jgi:hypothetical protein